MYVNNIEYFKACKRWGFYIANEGKPFRKILNG